MHSVSNVNVPLFLECMPFLPRDAQHLRRSPTARYGDSAAWGGDSGVLIEALHVALATVGRVEYVLTQNCRHIAIAVEFPRVYDLLPWISSIVDLHARRVFGRP